VAVLQGVDGVLHVTGAAAEAVEVALQLGVAFYFG
jgi:hypothetical protein